MQWCHGSLRDICVSVFWTSQFVSITLEQAALVFVLGWLIFLFRFLGLLFSLVKKTWCLLKKDFLCRYGCRWYGPGAHSSTRWYQIRLCSEDRIVPPTAYLMSSFQIWINMCATFGWRDHQVHLNRFIAELDSVCEDGACSVQWELLAWRVSQRKFSSFCDYILVMRTAEYPACITLQNI